MLVLVPHGLLGLVVASLAAAYMSTISTHLNWGASYVVDDVYRRFIKPDASEQHYVNVGRGATVALMMLACLIALWLRNAMFPGKALACANVMRSPTPASSANTFARSIEGLW